MSPMNVPQYLSDNVHRIPKTGEQLITLCSKEAIEKYIQKDESNRTEESNGRRELAQLIKHYSPETLQRDQVSQLYEEDLYKGFIATLLWVD
ncbi:MAG: hypothetical protein ABI151_05910 [Chitinophagaceae bacterium]